MGYEYTDEQKNAMNYGMNYGYQVDPYIERLKKMYGKYLNGNDPKGKLTRFLNPMRVAAGVRREGAVDDYTQEAAPAFSQGGADLTAASTAELRREYDRDEGLAEVGAYTARGEGMLDRLHQYYEDAKSRELQAYGIGSGVAGSGPHKTYGWGDFFNSVLQGGAQVAAAYAGGE